MYICRWAVLFGRNIFGEFSRNTRKHYPQEIKPARFFIYKLFTTGMLASKYVYPKIYSPLQKLHR